MAERSFKAEVEHLRKGEGETFTGYPGPPGSGEPRHEEFEIVERRSRLLDCSLEPAASLGACIRPKSRQDLS